MFNILPIDIILLISFKLESIFDVINLTSISKSIYENFNNEYYLEWVRDRYTKDFWDRASLRSKEIIKPQIGMKNELARIESFQKYLIKNNYEKWNNNDFFKYWESLESLYKNKGKTLY